MNVDLYIDVVLIFVCKSTLSLGDISPTVGKLSLKTRKSMPDRNN